MSITFDCPDAPKQTKPCSYCAEFGAPCVGGCDGTELIWEAPMCSFNQIDGVALLHELDLFDEYYCGEIEVKDLPALQRQLVRLLNSDRSALHRPSEKIGGGVRREGDSIVRCCSSVIPASTDDNVTRRLHALQRLVSYAQEHNYRIVWS